MKGIKQERLLKLMKKGKFYTTKELAKKVKMGEQTTLKYLHKLLRERKITGFPKNGVYMKVGK